MKLKLADLLPFVPLALIVWWALIVIALMVAIGSGWLHLR
jgi:hypothetical protein